jgi:hypothetical protein
VDQLAENACLIIHQDGSHSSMAILVLCCVSERGTIPQQEAPMRPR